MSFRDVIMAIQGYNTEFDLKEQLQWERIRWQTTLLLNVHTAKGKTLKPIDLIQFPWETTVKKDAKRTLTNADKNIFEKWDNEI